MKKLIRFESRRRPLFGNFAISFILAMLFALIPAWIYWSAAENERQATSRSNFTEYTNTRANQLQENIQTHVNTLNVLAATVPELKDLDSIQFRKLFEPFMQQLDAKSLCWHNAITGHEFSLPEQGSDCGHFKLFQSAVLLTDGDPRILLTQLAGDRSTARAGFISLVVDLSKLSLPAQYYHADIAESFYFDFADRQNLKRYQYVGSSLAEVDIKTQYGSADRKLSTIVSIPGLSIIYETINLNHPDSMPLLLGITAWLTTVLILLTIAVLLWQNGVLDREVAKRTEELSQFGYRASHDLKSPLVSIRQLCSFVVKDIRAGKIDSSIADVLRIQRQATGLEILVSEVLDLSRADVHVDCTSSIDFTEIAKFIQERHVALINLQGTKLHFNLATQLPTRGQYVRIVQILDNLISNALKYIPPERVDPLVEVSLSVEDSNLIVNIVDNGAGFSNAFYETAKVTMFKRYHPKLANGSGIGLAIVCKHVEKLQGTIAFEQMSLGSKVTVNLPIDNKGMGYGQL